MKSKHLLSAAFCSVALACPAQAGVTAAGPLLSTALPGVDGHIHRIDDWNGAVRVVNFWATWCAPCRSELPLLSATRRQWQEKRVEVIGVAVDNADEVRSYIEQAQVGYPMLVAERQGQALMRSSGNAFASLPYTLLLDTKGRILHQHAGVLDARMLQSWLAEATTH